MKKMLLFAALACLFVACSSTSGPKDAAEKFLTNLAKGEIEEAKKYATPQTGMLLDFAAAFGQMPVNPDFQFNFVKDSIVDDRAWVTYTTEKGGEEEVVELIKVDGDWKVNIDMDK